MEAIRLSENAAEKSVLASVAVLTSRTARFDPQLDCQLDAFKGMAGVRFALITCTYLRFGGNYLRPIRFYIINPSYNAAEIEQAGNQAPMNSVSEVQNLAFSAALVTFGLALLALALDDRRLLNIPMKDGWSRILFVLFFVFGLIKYYNADIRIGFQANPLWAFGVMLALSVAALLIKWKNINKGVDNGGTDSM